VITWCYRVSGFLSLLGSFFILNSIRKSKDKAKNTYHQALIGISLFDAFSSLMYMLGTVMTPKESGLYQAVGNNFTCKLQVSEFGFVFLLHAHPHQCLCQYFAGLLPSAGDNKCAVQCLFIYLFLPCCVQELEGTEVSQGSPICIWICDSSGFWIGLWWYPILQS